MAIVVEDGTGKADAVSYATIAAVAAYAAARGLTFTGTDEQKEASAVLATDYIDAMFTFIGNRNTATQALAWPRTDASDSAEGVEIPTNVVPAAVVRACCALAVEARAGTTLIANYDRGGMVKSETVGPISVTYMDGAPAETRFGVTGLLKGLLADGRRGGEPVFLEPEDGSARAFTGGMFNNS